MTMYMWGCVATPTLHNSNVSRKPPDPHGAPASARHPFPFAAPSRWGCAAIPTPHISNVSRKPPHRNGAHTSARQPLHLALPPNCTHRYQSNHHHQSTAPAIARHPFSVTLPSSRHLNYPLNHHRRQRWQVYTPAPWGAAYWRVEPSQCRCTLRAAASLQNCPTTRVAHGGCSLHTSCTFPPASYHQIRQSIRVSSCWATCCCSWHNKCTFSGTRARRTRECGVRAGMGGEEQTSTPRRRKERESGVSGVSTCKESLDADSNVLTCAKEESAHEREAGMIYVANVDVHMTASEGNERASEDKPGMISLGDVDVNMATSVKDESASEAQSGVISVVDADVNMIASGPAESASDVEPRMATHHGESIISHGEQALVEEEDIGQGAGGTMMKARKVPESAVSRRSKRPAAAKKAKKSLGSETHIELALESVREHKESVRKHKESVIEQNASVSRKRKESVRKHKGGAREHKESVTEQKTRVTEHTKSVRVHTSGSQRSSTTREHVIHPNKRESESLSMTDSVDNPHRDDMTGKSDDGPTSTGGNNENSITATNRVFRLIRIKKLQHKLQGTMPHAASMAGVVPLVATGRDVLIDSDILSPSALSQTTEERPLALKPNHWDGETEVVAGDILHPVADNNVTSTDKSLTLKPNNWDGETDVVAGDSLHPAADNNTTSDKSLTPKLDHGDRENDIIPGGIVDLEADYSTRFEKSLTLKQDNRGGGYDQGHVPGDGSWPEAADCIKDTSPVQGDSRIHSTGMAYSKGGGIWGSPKVLDNIDSTSVASTLSHASSSRLSHKRSRSLQMGPVTSAGDQVQRSLTMLQDAMDELSRDLFHTEAELLRDMPQRSGASSTLVGSTVAVVGSTPLGSTASGTTGTDNSMVAEAMEMLVADVSERIVQPDPANVMASAVGATAVQDPAVQGLAVQGATAPQSVVQAPTAQQPAVQGLAVQAPAVQAPAVQAPTVQVPAVQPPAVVSQPRQEALGTHQSWEVQQAAVEEMRASTTGMQQSRGAVNHGSGESVTSGGKNASSGLRSVTSGGISGTADGKEVTSDGKRVDAGVRTAALGGKSVPTSGGKSMTPGVTSAQALNPVQRVIRMKKLQYRLHSRSHSSSHEVPWAASRTHGSTPHLQSSTQTGPHHYSSSTSASSSSPSPSLPSVSADAAQNIPNTISIGNASQPGLSSTDRSMLENHTNGIATSAGSSAQYAQQAEHTQHTHTSPSHTPMQRLNSVHRLIRKKELQLTLKQRAETFDPTVALHDQPPATLEASLRVRSQRSQHVDMSMYPRGLLRRGPDPQLQLQHPELLLPLQLQYPALDIMKLVERSSQLRVAKARYISRASSRVPQRLAHNLPLMLDALLSLGISTKQSMRLVSCPRFIRSFQIDTPTSHNVLLANLPQFAILLGVPMDLAVRLVAKQPNLLRRSPQALKDNLEGLCEVFRTDRDTVSRLVVRYPPLLDLAVERAREQCQFVAELLQVPQEEAISLCMRFPPLIGTSSSTLSDKYNHLLRLLPFPSSHVAVMLKSAPTLLGLSSISITTKWNNLVIIASHSTAWQKELPRLPPKSLARFFTVGESVLNRLRYLQDTNHPAITSRGKPYGFNTLLAMSHQKFVDKFPDYAFWVRLKQ